jgi:AraC-like DNA-binding protein
MDDAAHFLYYLRMFGEPLSFLWTEYLPHYTCAIARTFPDYYGLQYLDGGRMTLQCEGQVCELHGAVAWCVYPGPQFSYAPAAPEGYWSHRYVTFQGPRAAAYVAEGLLPFPPQPVGLGLHLGERLDRLRGLVGRPDRLGQWQATHLLEGILLELAEARASTPAYPAWLPRLLQALDERLAAPIDYAQLAAEFGLSEATLRRQFKRHLGTPLHTYVLHKRLALACDLLRHSTLPIKEIARRLGYTDIYFFHRQFRQYQGVPPRQYRLTASASASVPGLQP